MNSDEDLDDYEYQQAYMEMSGPDDTVFEDLANDMYGSLPDYEEDHELEQYDEEQTNDVDIDSDSSSEDDNANTTEDKHPSHSFLPVLVQMEKNIIDPVLKEKYKDAIEKFKNNRSEAWDVDYSGKPINLEAVYDNESDDWIDANGEHHPDEDFLYVNISYYRDLDPRLYILCYKYFIKTYSFAEWYAQLSVAQKKYIKDNLHDFDLTDIQIRVINDDFNTPPSNENIDEILIEKSPDLSVADYTIDSVYREFYDVWLTYPMAGIVFDKFGKKDFDKIDLYELDDDVYSWLMEHYYKKLSEKKLRESQIRDYIKIILDFGRYKIRDSFAIRETDDKKIKAVEYFLRNKEESFAISKKMMKKEDNYEDNIANPRFFDVLYDDLNNWYDFYVFFKKNIDGKWRRMGFDSFHKWGLIEAINVTNGRKMKYNLEDNVLTFTN